MSDQTPAEAGGRWAGLPPGVATTSGAVIAGYRLDRQIGQGGMAVVYVARDERLRRPVALKILAPAFAADVAFRRRFIKESLAAAAVDDPHIIPIYETGEAEGVLFIAMRYVPGGDVRTLVQLEGPQAADRVAAIISPIASALDAAHEAGLIHRDVKPANMLIDVRPGRPDHLYLSDFGLSKGAMSSVGLTGAGQFLGTPDYCAPEQIDGREVSGQADQYALACAAFELLTGEPPFQRDHGLAVIYAHLSEPPPTASERRPDLPLAVDGVLAMALAKRPQDRYATCREFADELRLALGIPSYAPSPPVVAEAVRRAEPPAGAAAGQPAEPPAGAEQPAEPPADPAAEQPADIAAAIILPGQRTPTEVGAALPAFIPPSSASLEGRSTIEAARPAQAEPADTVVAPEQRPARSGTTRLDPLAPAEERDPGDAESAGQGNYDEDHEDHEDDEASAEDEPVARHRLPIIPSVLALFGLLVVGGLIAGYLQVNGQYYVGVQNGKIAIFRGINQRFLGISLSSVYKTTTIPLSGLPAPEAAQVIRALPAGSLAIATQLVASLRADYHCQTAYAAVSSWLAHKPKSRKVATFVNGKRVIRIVRPRYRPRPTVPADCPAQPAA